MRYALISDLHSNRQALKAVLLDIRSNQIDEIICLGDIIGYGPCPAETLELAYSNVHHFILGNHDAVIAGFISPDNFNDSAKRLIEWTNSRLDSKAAEFFKNNPLLLTGENFRCTHGEFDDPGRFGYIIEDEEAVDSFNSCTEQLLFAGHSHVPGLFVVGSGSPHWLTPQDFGTEEGKRYIVNVGSVGQPRDEGIRATYCIFDEEVRDVTYRQIPFDIDGYREDMSKNSLPTETTYFLNIADDMPQSNLRDLIDFSQLTQEDAVKIDNEEVDLREQVNKLKASRRNLTIMLLVLIITTISLLLLLFSGVFTKSVPKKAEFIVNSLFTELPPPLRALTPEKELVSMPLKTGAIDEENQPNSWTLTLTDPEKQKVSVEEILEKGEKVKVFKVSSDKPETISLTYLPVPAKKGMRFTGLAYFNPINRKNGFVEILLKQKFSDGTEKILLNKEPINFSEVENEWIRTPLTIPSKKPIAMDGNLYFVIRCQFAGEILIKKCSLKRK